MSAKKSAPLARKVTMVKPVARVADFFTPLDDRLIIAVDPAPQKTAGGLIIPGDGERPNRGRVLAAGPGRRSKKGKVRPLDVAVGDSVLFAQFAGDQIKIGDDDLLILREDEVLGIVT